MGLTKYIKAAFLWHWNLLAFGAGMAVSFLSGHPDIVAPLVVAVEVAYLGFLGTHPKFQHYVNAQEAKSARAQAEGGKPEETMKRLLLALPAAMVKRFEELRNRCLELRQIAREIRDPNQAGGAPPLEEMQLAGLDRLLWIYLRLLFTQHSLERFFVQTNEPQIQRDIKSLEDRLKKLPEKSDDPQKQKIKKAIEDNLVTCRGRLTNLQKARENHELIQLEIDRLENKIRSLSELAVNRQEPNFISGQVDQVASSMMQTEKTMSDLQFVTGLDTADEAVPEMLPRDVIAVKD